MTTKKLKAALYIRVSTDMQVDKDSLPLQEKDLRTMAQSLGIEDVEVFNDAGYSGKNTDRPKFQEMMTRCRVGEFSHVLIWKLDRISRNLVDFCGLSEELKKLGVALISKYENFDTSSVIGEAIMKIIMIFAEMERKNTVLRVTAIMNNRAKEGIWNGGPPPFGYMKPPDDGQEHQHPLFPVPDPIEAPKVLAIFQAYAESGSMNKAAQIVSALGIRSREGVIISPTHIGRIINKQFYIGNYQYNRRDGEGKTRSKDDWITAEGTHEGIVPKELFEKCQNIKKNNRDFHRKPGQRSTLQERHLFAGYCYCSRCGHSLNANILPSRMHPNAPFLATRYSCNHRFDAVFNCDAHFSASELSLLPWMLTFVSRMIYACQHPQLYPSDKALVDFLIAGIFDGCTGIVESFDLLRAVRSHAPRYMKFDDGVEVVTNDMIVAELKKEKDKEVRALQRLDKVFMYGDVMTEEEYMNSRKKALDNIERIENNIEDLNAQSSVSEEKLIAKGAQLILIKKLQDINANFEYYSIVKVVGKKLLREFFMAIIDRLEFDQRSVKKIVFKNGLTVTLKY